MKSYEFFVYDEVYHVYPIKQQYRNDKLAVLLVTTEGEELAVITVNLPDVKLNKSCAHIDTNNAPWAVRFLNETKIAQHTGEFDVSGYCMYPVFKFDESKLYTEQELSEVLKDEQV